MRIAIISDIHSDLPALQAVLKDIEKQHVDEIFCLGDVVGYGEHPIEVVQLLKENKINSVMGNHDKVLATGQYPFVFTDDAVYEIDCHKKVMDKESFEFIASLPESISAYDLLFVHGLPPSSLEQYVDYVTHSELIDSFGNFSEQLAFVGHTHRFGIYELQQGFISKYEFTDSCFQLNSNRTIVNVGSVGFSRDGHSQPAYAIYDEGKFSVEQRRVNCKRA